MNDKATTSNLSIVNLFLADVIKWRQHASKLWSVCIIFALVLVHNVTANQNTLSDIFSGLFASLLQMRFWACTTSILFVYCLLFIFYDKLFRVSPRVFSNNLEKTIHIIYSFHLACLLSNIVATWLIATLLLQLYADTQINYFYVVTFCLLTNLASKFQQSFNGSYLLKWPVIEQTKYARFKSKVYTVLLDTIKQKAVHLVAWQMIYLFIGSGAINLFTGVFSHQFRIFDFCSLRAAFKLACIIDFAQSVSWLLYEIYMTEVYHFNVQPTSPLELSLATAMSLTSHPYVQTLAIIDFSYLSVYSKSKRQQLFSLNYPSNQPVNWSRASNEALSAIMGFMDVFNFDDMLHGNGRMSRTAECAGATLGSATSGRLTTHAASGRRVVNTITSPLRDAAASKRVTSPFKIASPTCFDGSGAAETAAEQQHRFACNNKVLLVSNQIWLKLRQQLCTRLKNHKLYALVVNENTNYKTQRLFEDSFLVIHALQGLANIAMASFSEDEYGIVQQTLPDIITTFIGLQKILERFNPTNTSTGLSFKVLQKDNAPKIELYIQKLTFVLNESIYKITTTFGSSIKSFTLSDDVAKRLNKYYIKQ